MAYRADLRYPQPLPESASDRLVLAEEELAAIGREALPEGLRPLRGFVREGTSEELPVNEPGAEPLRRPVARMSWRAEALAGEEDRDARVGEEVLPLPRGWRTWAVPEIPQGVRRRRPRLRRRPGARSSGPGWSRPCRASPGQLLSGAA